MSEPRDPWMPDDPERADDAPRSGDAAQADGAVTRPGSPQPDAPQPEGPPPDAPRPVSPAVAARTGYELDVEEQDEPEPEKAPRTVRGTVEVSARLVTGAVGVAVAAATLLAAAFLPLPGVTAPPPTVAVVPVAAEQQRVCAGPLLRLGDDSGQGASSASALGNPTVTDAADSGDVRRTKPETTNEVSGHAATLLTLAATGDEVPLFAGSQWQAVSSGDFVGGAAAECIEPSDESWLVGGSTATGRTTLLSIVNPGAVVATVDISLYSESGEVVAPGASAIAIAPHTERIYPLAGFAPDLATPVVRVLSSGGQVVATLQQSTVRTLDPGGIDYVATSVAPTDSSVIPGIVFGDAAALDAAIAGEDSLDLRPALRFFVPGEEQGHATVTMTRATDVGGDAAIVADPIDIDLTLEAGRVTELPLGDFEGGSYTASIESDVPIVAGARIATVGADGANDFTWLPTSGELADEALVAVAQGPSPTLNLANPGAGDIDVDIADGAGETRTVTVPGGGAMTVAVEAGATYTLSGFDSLHATVGFLADGVIAAHTISPRGPTSAPITVYP